MDDSAIKIGQLFYNPRDLGCSYPFACIFQFVFASQIDSINEVLNLSDRQHFWYFAVVLNVKPREKGLQGAISTAPPLIVE